MLRDNDSINKVNAILFSKNLKNEVEVGDKVSNRAAVGLLLSKQRGGEYRIRTGNLQSLGRQNHDTSYVRETGNLKISSALHSFDCARNIDASRIPGCEILPLCYFCVVNLSSPPIDALSWYLW